MSCDGAERRCQETVPDKDDDILRVLTAMLRHIGGDATRREADSDDLSAWDGLVHHSKVDWIPESSPDLLSAVSTSTQPTTLRAQGSPLSGAAEDAYQELFDEPPSQPLPESEEARITPTIVEHAITAKAK